LNRFSLLFVTTDLKRCDVDMFIDALNQPNVAMFKSSKKLVNVKIILLQTARNYGAKSGTKSDPLIDSYCALYNSKHRPRSP
jgi:hypothetical protein